MVGRSGAWLGSSPGSEHGFTGERRGDAFNRRSARKSAASPQNAHITAMPCDSQQARRRRKLVSIEKHKKNVVPGSVRL
jgi:hypothetical protein